MSPRGTLWLHVGHGKTGSSALQSSFAKSVGLLANLGIHYPDHPSIPHAARGGITSGNAQRIFEDEGKHIGPTIEQDLANAKARGCRNLLYSSEILYHRILQRPGLLDDILSALRWKRQTLRVILYVRDPLDYAISAYIQMVKRGRETRSFGAYLRTFNPLEKLPKFVDALDARKVEWNVRNYSAVAEDLVGSIEGILNLPSGLLSRGDNTPVNRSLSNAELEVQRLFNEYSPTPTSSFVSDSWCEALPHIKSEIPSCNPKDLKDFLQRCEERLPTTNRLLPLHAQLKLDGSRGIGPGDIPKTEPKSYRFSRSQLEVLIKGISAQFPQS